MFYMIIPLFLQRDFVDPPYVSASFKWSIQKGFDSAFSFLLTDKPTGHDEYVGIIVFTSQSCNLFLPA